jgi:hemin uptake protein HemP
MPKRSGDVPMNVQNPTPTQGYAVSMLPAHKAEDLTKGGNLAHIELGDQLYTLRITRAGKLILTK